MPTLAQVRAAKARRSLLSFTSFTNGLYEAASHHKLICDKLEAVEAGKIDRLMIFMPPRHGKSELASKRFPAWCLGRDPARQIIAASYNSELAADFGRNVRNIVAEPEFAEVFPGVTLAQDSHAAARLNTNHGGAYVAAGVGTAVTGRGAHIALIDDPFKDREEADSERRRDLVWDWYRSTLFTRLMPGGAIVLIQCMVGDTRVRMASGGEKLLRDIRPGDRVATYCEGRLASSRVLNWAAQGVDAVFKIRTTSGIIVEANARHPFLVERNGKLEWIRLKNIRVGDRILRVTGANGAVSNVRLPDAISLLGAGACANRTTTRSDGRTGLGRHQHTAGLGRTPSCVTAMALGLTNTRPCSNDSGADAPSADALQVKDRQSIGAKPSALTIATTLEESGGFCATTAISLSAEDATRPCFDEQPNTFRADEVASITAAGREIVYDIQVEHTENFIANGLVSHNTRWHEDDLAGRLLASESDWDVLELPALDSDGNALWPEWYDEAALARIRATIGPREWSALYQQRPQPDEGTFFQRAWFKEWEKLPQIRYYGTSDYAVTDGGGDYTVHRIWGIDASGAIYRVDGWRGQATSDVWIEKKLDLIAKHKPLCWFGEGGVIQKAVEPMLRRRMRERQVFCRLEWLSSIHDKPTRARSFQAMAASGRVHFEKGADLSEFLSFPAGKHDDEVDTASLIGRAIDQAHPAIVAAGAVLPKRRDYGMNAREEADWKTV